MEMEHLKIKFREPVTLLQLEINKKIILIELLNKKIK